jgi:hypothetical protein
VNGIAAVGIIAADGRRVQVHEECSGVDWSGMSVEDWMRFLDETDEPHLMLM